MATQHNTFIRKFGDLAILITVTDWDDFKELELLAKEGHENPDFLVTAVTTKSIYSNMLPNIVVSTYNAVDISEGTKGMGLAGIMTDGCDMPVPNHPELKNGGPFWAFRKCGLSVAEQFSRPDINETIR